MCGLYQVEIFTKIYISMLELCNLQPFQKSPGIFHVELAFNRNCPHNIMFFINILILLRRGMSPKNTGLSVLENSEDQIQKEETSPKEKFEVEQIINK